MKKLLVVSLVIGLSGIGYTCNMSVQQNGTPKQTLMTAGDTTLNFAGQGIVVSNSGSQSATVNLAGLQTTQSNANTTNITTLQTGLETTNSNVTILQNGLDTTNSNVTTLQNGLATTNSNLATTNVNVAKNTTVIANEITRAEGAEEVLTTNLNKETSRAIGAEAGLQNQINNTNQQVSNLDNRVNDLERLKVMPEAAVRFYDSRHLSLAAYDTYDATNGRNYATGIKVILKLGKSYEERLVDVQKRQLDTQAAELKELHRLVHDLVAQKKVK